MEKRPKRLKKIDTIELDIKDREKYLEWRDTVLKQYEQSKIEYNKELRHLLGYDDK
ncbi:hypothetical protein [Lacrimispora indolis]|uniref:hypothetical protein n=1 Tax=Lacrimispora indolis TaxID=69825 RepID=UPI00040808A5|nr:hypothetical protein [[Clostridium] methoxybenzovorans]